MIKMKIVVQLVKVIQKPVKKYYYILYENCNNIFDAAAQFGGYKRSGFVREIGIHDLENHTQVKKVIIQRHHYQPFE